MITVISSTNRVDAKTKAVAEKIIRDLKAKKCDAQLCDLNKLPRGLFEAENYWNTPKEFEPFQDMILHTDGIIVVTPEYNGSFPGVFKYFIDLLKFPESFKNKIVAFVGISAGIFGATRAIDQLTQILQYREAYIFNRKIYLMRIDKIFDTEKLEFTDASLQKLYTYFIEGFVKYIS